MCQVTTAVTSCQTSFNSPKAFHFTLRGVLISSFKQSHEITITFSCCKRPLNEKSCRCDVVLVTLNVFACQPLHLVHFSKEDYWLMRSHCFNSAIYSSILKFYLLWRTCVVPLFLSSCFIVIFIRCTTQYVWSLLVSALRMAWWHVCFCFHIVIHLS